jgi:hypothetical protein
VPNAKDVTPESEFVKVLVVGDAGTGKSIFAASFPTPGFLFDTGNGVQSYRGKDFDYEQYPKTGLGWVKFEKDFVATKKAVEEGKYKTVVLDDTTALGDLAMERSLQLDPKRSATGGPVWNIHYMMVRNLVEGKLRQFVDLKANIILIAHMDIVTDQETGNIVAVQPLLTGQLAARVPGYFDEVYFATTRREGQVTKWLLQTIPIGLKGARSRLSGKEHLLPDFVPNDYEALVKLMKEKKSHIQPETKQGDKK